MVIYRADSMQLIKRFADPKKKAIYVEKTTDEAAKNASVYNLAGQKVTKAYKGVVIKNGKKMIQK